MFNFVGSIFHKVASIFIGGLLLVGIGHQPVASTSISTPPTIASQNTATSTDSEINSLQTALAQEKATEAQLEQKINSISQTPPVSNTQALQTSNTTNSVPQINTPTSLTAKQIFDKVSPSVVLVAGSQEVGSGFVIEGGKYILTNEHVVKSDSSVTVYLPDGESFQAPVLGTSESFDLALLYSGNLNPPALTLGSSNSNSLSVGDNVYALGYPKSLYGLTNMTLTNGVLSARNTPDGSTQSLLQTNAAINSGNSGGPLVDDMGNVVGINSYSLNNSQGIYFAIPIDTAISLIPQLSQYGQSRYELYPIGSTQNISAAEQEQIDLNPNIDCSTLFTGNELTICTLYKNYKGDYDWNVIGSLSNY